ncbi:MAG: hypothetical protein RDA78_06095 [Roseibium sp.]|uniref:hypothetical protein n=1 Tax=Roseibium sp. TaxID=1936156 RepID=UPI003D9C512B
MPAVLEIEKSVCVDKTGQGMRAPSMPGKSRKPNDEEIDWLDDFVEKMSQPGPNEEAHFAERRKRRLGVGLNAAGEIVRAEKEPEKP